MQKSSEAKNTAPNLNTFLLRKLSFAVKGHAATATFACGGSVPRLDIPSGQTGIGQRGFCPFVTLRWDKSQHAEGIINFPLPHHDAEAHQRLQNLCDVSEPATFGLGGRDVLDESYRKASKLDPSDFSTNFHPHDCGILDCIQQILLPSTIKGGQGIGIGPHGVRAELYKLNVRTDCCIMKVADVDTSMQIYSAPSGKFLSHVDTPRGPLQFGSLVVCLPCSHQGGTLRVKHRGQTVDFPWADNNPQAIQWAAFYGDCEHEVLEVTEGHRVTLTYNLYYSSIGKLAQPVSHPHHLPLYNVVRDMLQESTFMRQGGILGFFCHHQYAHSQESGRKSIPMAFKGVDLAVYSVFQGLGLRIGVHPIIENEKYNMGGLSAKDLMSSLSRPDGDQVENCLADMAASRDSHKNDDDYDKHSRFYATVEELATIVGTRLHSPTFDENIEEDSTVDVTDAWPHHRVPQIKWMNEPAHKDFAFASLRYGNYASLNYKFLAASILVVVPASSKRMLPPTPCMASDIASIDVNAAPNTSTAAVDRPLGSERSIAGQKSPADSNVGDATSGTNRFSGSVILPDRTETQYFANGLSW